MEIEAYCDDCYTPVPREHAEARKPCPKCGNTFYAVLNRERYMPSGNHAYFIQREANLTKYYDTLQEIQAIRITGMTAETYARYIEAGEQNIAVFERAMDELVAQDKSIGTEPLIPPYIPMPTKLPDMYMRHDRWDDAIRVYDFCAAIPYLSNMDFEELKKECAENRACTDAIEALVASGVSSQREIKKALSPSFPPRPINYCLGYSCRFSRIKTGSDYTVSVTPMDSRF